MGVLPARFNEFGEGGNSNHFWQGIIGTPTLVVIVKGLRESRVLQLFCEFLVIKWLATLNSIKA